MDIRQLVTQRILVLDGAIGTMIQGYGLRESDFRGTLSLQNDIQYIGNNDMLCITRPDIVQDIHRRYLEAGADLIETNTFSAQRISQADYQLEELAYDMALAGTKLAREMADLYSTEEKPRFVLGSIGPTNRTCSISPDVSDPSARKLDYDTLLSAYIEQVNALTDGGVDAFLIETIFDTLNAKVAIDAVTKVLKERKIDLPIMLSVTVSDLSRRTLSGQTLDAFFASISSYPIFSVGLNCSFGPSQMKPFIEELATKSPFYISAYPNAGLPNSLGCYDETAETVTSKMAELIDGGKLNIIGGCCGTDDTFIARYAEMVKGKTPYHPCRKSRNLKLSGLELLEVKPGMFINVGERCNVAGSRKFLRLIKEKKYEEALSIAQHQVSDGAMVIDVNMDDALLEAESEMRHFLLLLASEPDVARVPIMIDSSKWNVVLAGLKCCQGKSIVNSISLKEGEEVFISHALDVKRFGAAIVVMCFDEEGQATSYERRIEIAQRAYRILTEKVGMNANDIIFDPNILSIATGLEEHDRYALDFIRATQWIRENLPGAHVSGGISNLSFSFRGNNYIREAMHSVFLHYAIQAGMDFGIVNPASHLTYQDIPKDHLHIIEDAILYRSNNATEKLTALAKKGILEQTTKESVSNLPNSQGDEWRALSLEERLRYALCKGTGDYLTEDLTEALNIYPHAVQIIEGPLMDGMSEVGQLFSQGKMFLPQVVKTARTMKQAVAILQPYIEAERTSNQTSSGRVILATVKGDVHDIGKNIVGVVMACNNYDVIDLGVMIPANLIVEKAIELKADIIGLSGLITPSLEEMIGVVKELERHHLNIPIMIGGATTSEMYVALKLAPIYGGPVVWMKDASQNPLAASRLLNKNERDIYKNELDKHYEHLRLNFHQEQQRILSIDEARGQKINLFG